jgi:Kef-type K+ transport system membrane component KefB
VICGQGRLLVVEHPFTLAALWMGLALLSSVLASRLKIAGALMEIVVGVVAGAIAVHFWGDDALGAKLPWLTFLASTGSVLLTFLAGAELDPDALRAKWKEVLLVGFVSFLAPFLGCAFLARFALGWSWPASWLAGVALSTTSMAVVYAVMLESGFNRTEFGKGILGACFITDLGTVIALGLIFSPFTWRTLIFVVGCTAACASLPLVTRRLLHHFGGTTAEVETKWVLLVAFGLGALALWSGSEAVLPAYIAGMVLAGTLGRDHAYIRRLRTLVVGLLTPFFFLRAGSLVSLPALVAGPGVLAVLLLGKVATKIVGLQPTIALFRKDRRERWYYTLLMSTGLTFGSISALFGLTHGIVNQDQYSWLVAVVIGSAVLPTLVATTVFAPRHLLTRTEPDAPAPVPVVVPKAPDRPQAEA